MAESHSPTDPTSDVSDRRHALRLTAAALACAAAAVWQAAIGSTGHAAGLLAAVVLAVGVIYAETVEHRLAFAALAQLNAAERRMVEQAVPIADPPPPALPAPGTDQAPRVTSPVSPAGRRAASNGSAS